MSERTSTEAPAAGGDAATAEVGDDFQTAFWSAKHALAHAAATAFARHGVYEGQQFVLRCLWREDGLSPGEIARRLGLSTPTVTRAATRMAAAGCYGGNRTRPTAAWCGSRSPTAAATWRRSSTRKPTA